MQTELKDLLLDTSFIMDWFENAIKVYRSNPEEYETKKFELTSKMEFLHQSGYQLFTTNIARAEVFRKLISEKSARKIECPLLWEDFISSFSITVLKVKEVDFDEVGDLCLVTPLNRGSIPNLIQLQFAKKNNLPFATGDNRVKEKYTDYYEKIYTYIELRKISDARQS